jgi:hypothetical protein
VTCSIRCWWKGGGWNTNAITWWYSIPTQQKMILCIWLTLREQFAHSSEDSIINKLHDRFQTIFFYSIRQWLISTPIKYVGESPLSGT